jgi:hypothetical protein
MKSRIDNVSKIEGYKPKWRIKSSSMDNNHYSLHEIDGPVAIWFNDIEEVNDDSFGRMLYLVNRANEIIATVSKDVIEPESFDNLFEEEFVVTETRPYYELYCSNCSGQIDICEQCYEHFVFDDEIVCKTYKNTNNWSHKHIHLSDL